MFRQRAAAPRSFSHKRILQPGPCGCLEREREKYRVLPNRLSGTRPHHDVATCWSVPRSGMSVRLGHHRAQRPKTLLRSSFIHEDDRAIVLKGFEHAEHPVAVWRSGYDLRGRLRMVRRMRTPCGMPIPAAG